MSPIPATGLKYRHRAEFRQGRDAPRHRGRRRGVPDLAQDVGCSSARSCCASCTTRIMDNQQPLAELLTTEQGKSLAESQGRGRAIARPMCCGSPRKPAASMATSIPRPGRTAASSSPRSRSASSRAITPWNFPSSMLSRKLGAGAGRRLHRRDQAGVADALFGARLGRAVRGGRLPARASSTSSPARPARSATRSDRQSAGAGSSPSPARPRSARC